MRIILLILKERINSGYEKVLNLNFVTSYFLTKTVLDCKDVFFKLTFRLV